MAARAIRRTADGGLRVTIPAGERDMLASLPRQLRPILTGEVDGDLADAIRRRLFPAAYAEDEAEQEFRELMGSTLLDGRLEQLDTFEATLAAGEEHRASWTVDLDADQAQAWLAVVNDMRLALGRLLGITTEQDWEGAVEEDDPASVMLWYLGVLEEGIVEALMGSLPDE
jgi:hypothetical protein